MCDVFFLQMLEGHKNWVHIKIVWSAFFWHSSKLSLMLKMCDHVLLFLCHCWKSNQIEPNVEYKIHSWFLMLNLTFHGFFLYHFLLLSTNLKWEGGKFFLVYAADKTQACFSIAGSVFFFQNAETKGSNAWAWAWNFLAPLK